MICNVVSELHSLLVPIDDLVPDPRNAVKHPERSIEAIKVSLAEFGQDQPLVVQREGMIVRKGNGRLEAARQLGWTHVAAVILDEETIRSRARAVADNRSSDFREWDFEVLREDLASFGDDFSFDDVMFDSVELATFGSVASPSGEVIGVGGDDEDRANRLREQFGVPPFTVLDARQDYWQERKRAWLAIGIKSGEGRGNNLLRISDQAYRGYDSTRSSMANTSIFDPVLCELAYRWFAPRGGRVVDPFAGGSVRGIVASKLGRDYVGVDLREEQVVSNEAQARTILAASDGNASWVTGDSRDLAALVTGPFDMMFTCPPYYDLEVYGDDSRDLSTAQTYEEFIEGYRAILKAAVDLLAPDRFAAIVVGEIRDRKTGMYRGFVPDTIAAMRDAGAGLYNEAILVTSIGTLPLRAGKIFKNGRKLGKTHQNVLVFCKGSPERAHAACGDVVGEIPDLSEAVVTEFGERIEGAAVGGEL
jgi:16S rRNA G966 N2-methylase RsmD